MTRLRGVGAVLLAALSMAGAGDAAGRTDSRSNVQISLATRGATLSAQRGPQTGGDPDLEPGFPVQTFETAGTYHAGQAIHALVGNIDGDPTLEIVVTALANGPLYAWNSDGSTQPGWPLSDFLGAGYPALGEFSPASPGLEVFAGYFAHDNGLVAYNGSDSRLPGWPRNAANFVASPAGLGDVDGDGLDEIFIEEEIGYLHGYRASGSVLGGWPGRCNQAGQALHTPAIGDLDGNRDLEIVSATSSTSNGGYLCAFHHDGSYVAGFPRLMAMGNDVFVAMGDVDGDGEQELVLRGGEPGVVKISILDATGAIERSMVPAGEMWDAPPALADLDGDGVPEIVAHSIDALNVWKGDGTVFPGWPRTWPAPQHWIIDSAPVIGDVDGDTFPDIAVTVQVGGSGLDGEVWLFNRFGVMHPHFPKPLPIGPGAVPAIADIDLDGRNELVVMGSGWAGQSRLYDKVWAYD